MIKKKYQVLSGLSDHTLGSIAALTSVALGGSVLEKHFNLNDNTKTVDSFFSLNNNDFKKMVDEIRDVESSLGKSVFKLDKSSMENFYSRRSIYVSEKILKNELITTKNVKIVRPGYGLEPKYLKKILGKRSKKNLKPGTRFKLSYCK